MYPPEMSFGSQPEGTIRAREREREEGKVEWEHPGCVPLPGTPQTESSRLSAHLRMELLPLSWDEMVLIH